MSARDARARAIRFNVMVLIAIGATLAALIAGLGLLRPPVQPLVSEPPASRVVECDAVPAGSPIMAKAASLLACADVFDGREVVVVGEAIGDRLRGPAGRRWVQVNDDAYAHAGPLGIHFQALGTNSGIAVLLPPGAGPAVLGGPGVRGDLIEVTGVFRAAASEDQGGPAVIAGSVRVLRPGEEYRRPASGPLRTITPLAVVLTAALLAAARRRRAAR